MAYDENLWRLKEHLDTRTSQELQLVADRMDWLMTSQSFLFGGWAAGRSVSPKVEDITVFLAILGVILSFTVYIGIIAAMRVLSYIVSHCLEKTECELGLPLTGYKRHTPWTIWAGNIPALVLSPAVVGAWICIGLHYSSWKVHWDGAGALGAGVAGLLIGLGAWAYNGRSNITQPMQLSAAHESALDEVFEKARSALPSDG
jgi:hypothetical protein